MCIEDLVFFYNAFNEIKCTTYLRFFKWSLPKLLQYIFENKNQLS